MEKQIVITITHPGVPKEYIGKLDEKLSHEILELLSNAGISADYHNHITDYRNGINVCPGYMAESY